jgi:hypothetical protein
LNIVPAKALATVTGLNQGLLAMARTAEPRTVLLVEDELLISHFVAEELSEYGFAVHESATAEDALRYIDSGAAVDVLFTDINCQAASTARNWRSGYAPSGRNCRSSMPPAATLRRGRNGWYRARCSCPSPTSRLMSARCWHG